MQRDIIPAILPKDFAELEEKISLINNQFDCVQVDICDGQFTPNPSWPYRKHDNNFENLIKENIGLPSWENIDYEFDLMINKAEEVIDDWIRIGASRIIIHVESNSDIDKIIDIIDNQLEIGLALNIDTPIESLENFAERISFIQCMGIDNIGFQGQQFDQKTFNRLKELKTKYPEKIISVDGGVSLENVKDLFVFGADRLVVGSAIFGSQNVFQTIQDFQEFKKI